MVWYNPRFKKLWEPVGVSDAKALSLPGYKRRAWNSVKPFYLDRVSDNPRGLPNNVIFFTLIAYVKGNETLFEVRTRDGVSSTDSKTVPIEIVTALVTGAVDSGLDIRELKNATIVEKEGRALVKVESRDILARHTIYRTPLGYLCGEFGGAFAFMIRYPNTVKTFEDGKIVDTEMGTLASSWTRLMGKSDDYDKQRWLDRLNETQKNLEKCNERFDNVCNEAADSINALAEEFGIEIAI